MTNVDKSLQNLYNEREKFIVIGLTGRTGSGCSTTAKILSQENINQIKLPNPKISHFNNNEERKYRIAYNYIFPRWQPFNVISIKDIITSFILETPLAEFTEFICKNNDEQESETIVNTFVKEIEDRYNNFFDKRKCLKNLEEKDDTEVNNKAEYAVEFYLQELPNFTKELQTNLNKISPELYTTIYQLVGDNIRLTGKAVDGSFEPNSVYCIAKRVNKIIKAIRETRKTENNGSVFIAIDAIRNPLEALFFRDRYSAFYLASVNTPNEVRIQRLQKSRINLTSYQIENLDSKEYASKLSKKEKFISQDIKKCIEISDIHLNNPQIGENDFSVLKKQIAWYLALIMHPGLVTPTPLERCMQVAYGAKLNSGCISRQVGAVITDINYSVKAIGWNNTPEGQVPCLLRNVEDLIRHDDKQAFSNYENNDLDFREVITATYPDSCKTNRDVALAGRNISFCFKDIKNSIDGDQNQVHTRSLHAEENAFLQLAKYGGEGIKGGILFTTASPCELCAKKAYQLGITKIVYIDPYPGISKKHILESGNIQPDLELFHGAIGRAYHQLYQPILPFKDELAMLIYTENPKPRVSEISTLKSQIQRLEDENKILKEKLQEQSEP